MRHLLILCLLIPCLAFFAATQDCPDYTSSLDKASVRFLYDKTASKESANPGPSQLIVNYTVSECYHCLDRFYTNFTANTDPNVNTSYYLFPTEYTGTFTFYYQIVTEDPDTGIKTVANMPILTQGYDLKERGQYTFEITDTVDPATKDWNGIQFKQITDKEGNNIWIPLYVAISIFVGITLIYNLTVFILNKRKNGDSARDSQIKDGLLVNSMNDGDIRPMNIENPKDRNTVGTNAGSPTPKAKKMSERLQSLDTFRGIALTIMLFVNSGAGGYIELDHALWNGLHFADLVFPWFIWMMGVSMAISFNSQMRRGATKRDMFTKALVRTAKLFVLALMTQNSVHAINELRLPGVLMRFCWSYFVVSLIIIFVPRNKREDGPRKNEDLIAHVYEFIPVLLILGLWLGLTFGLKMEGCPTGYLGPGGLLGDYGKYPNCTGGASGYIDWKLLGPTHLYHFPTPQEVYITRGYDPEGILGLLTSIVMVYFGVMAGRVIVYYKEHKERLTRWAIGAVILGIISLILTKASTNEGIIPINKNMWSLSFITTLACFGLLVLSALYIFMDIMKLWGGSPFKAMGMNSIVIYCGSDFLAGIFPFQFDLPTINGCYNPSNDTHGFLLFRDLKNALIWVVVANWMDYEKLYFNL